MSDPSGQEHAAQDEILENVRTLDTFLEDQRANTFGQTICAKFRSTGSDKWNVNMECGGVWNAKLSAWWVVSRI